MTQKSELTLFLLAAKKANPIEFCTIAEINDMLLNH
jgi:hypothetical protein